MGKQRGDRVAAGTVNSTGSFVVKVDRTGRDTTLSRIIDLVEEAQMSKAPVQRMVDRIVPLFVTVTLFLGAVTFYIWMDEGLEKALMAATSVLIITCPCALGLATPTAIAVASGLGAGKGVLIKDGAALELLASARHFLFDKTGTLTEGMMTVVEIVTGDGCEDNELLRFAAAAERNSEHAIAKALLRAADEKGVDHLQPRVDDFDSVPGMGVEAVVDGRTVKVGSRRWVEDLQVEGISSFDGARDRMEEKGMTVVYVSVDSSVSGLIGVADRLRPEAPGVIAALRDRGVKSTLLSGDRSSVVTDAAARLGGMDVKAELLPGDKERQISIFQEKGERVVMVGDGVNDAPALVRADVGVAVGSGTDVSVESADIVLMRSGIDGVVTAFDLSRRTISTIRQNMGISFLYNAVMVPLAMSAMVTPVVAAVAMPISSLLVIGNAARIRRFFE